MAQTVLRVCNPTVTCLFHLQRKRNENCPATSSQGPWGELGAPGEFLHWGTGTEGSGQWRGDPQSHSPLCSSESLSASSEEPAAVARTSHISLHQQPR